MPSPKILFVILLLGAALAADYFSFGHRILTTVHDAIFHGSALAKIDKAHIKIGSGDAKDDDDESCADESDDPQDDAKKNAKTADGRQQLEWPADGRHLSINAPMHLTYRPGGPREFFVENAGRDKAMIRVKDGTLTYLCGSGRHHGGTPDVTLSGVVIEQFSVAGAGQLDLVAVDQPTLSVTLSGAGMLEGSGRADNLDVNVAGASKVDLGHLLAKYAKISLAGASDARLSVAENADVSVAGIGHVHWVTKPTQLTSHVAGLGKVEETAD